MSGSVPSGQSRALKTNKEETNCIMQLKQIFIAALAAASAAGASAADVTVYGVINTGLSYTRTEAEQGKTTDSFVMDSGNYLGSRVGLKGEEDLGNGFAAGFVLENGFSSDTGTLSDDGRIFGREASLYIRSDRWGTLRFGRMTVMTGSTGTSSLMAGRFSAMSTGWGIVYGHNAVFTGTFGRMDNMLMYSTPKFGGLQLHVQYSSGIDTVNEKNGTENKGSSTRYMAAGFQYFSGPFSLIGVADSYRYADTQDDPAFTANLGAAYDFEAVKVFLAGQWFQDMRRLGKAPVDSSIAGASVFGSSVAKDGFALNAGANVPLAGGTLHTALGFMDAERSNDASLSMTRWTLSAGYELPLSKRTVVYAGAGWMLDRYDDFGAAYKASNENASNYGVTFGLSHRF